MQEGLFSLLISMNEGPLPFIHARYSEKERKRCVDGVYNGGVFVILNALPAVNANHTDAPTACKLKLVRDTGKTSPDIPPQRPTPLLSLLELHRMSARCKHVKYGC